MRLGRFALPALGVCALAVAGCSDPTAPASRGAIVMFVTEPGTGQTCGLSHNTVIPTNARVGVGGPSTERVINGEGGASVSCQLRGDAFTAVIELATPMGTQNVSISGNVAEGGAGSARMTNFTSQTQQTLRSPDDRPCLLQPAEVSRERVFSRFECEALNVPPSNFCVAQGYFVFENCE